MELPPEDLPPIDFRRRIEDAERAKREDTKDAFKINRLDLGEDILPGDVIELRTESGSNYSFKVSGKASRDKRGREEATGVLKGTYFENKGIESLEGVRINGSVIVPQGSLEMDVLRLNQRMEAIQPNGRIFTTSPLTSIRLIRERNQPEERPLQKLIRFLRRKT